MFGILELFFVIAQLIGAGYLIVYWIYFWFVERKNPKNSQVYIAFESSFPLADLLCFTPSLLIAAIGLITEQRFGVFFVTIAGGVSIFLGLLDLSFNLQQGQYKGKISDTILNFVNQGYCFIFGILYLIYGFLNF